MNARHIGFFIIVQSMVFFLYGCSTTPGDAANRGSHHDAAADLYRQGVENNDSLAAFKLGMLIHNGKVSPNKYGSAGSWFNRGCELGDLTSCHNAGVGYEYGQHGLVQSYEQARFHYQKAAEHSYTQSQYNLGSLYANQHFSNDIEGLKWLLISQSQARKCIRQPLCKWILEDPPGHMPSLISRMTLEDIQAAKMLAKKWESESGQ
ncbi:MAG: tetratricopeptide repeat protein [Sedimenticola sp.]